MLRRVKKYITGVSRYYLKSRTKAIEDHTILLEAGQGKNLNGNMFAIVRELNSNEAWKKMHAVFVVTKDTKEEAEKRFAAYNYKVTLVCRNTKEYAYYLACAKYLMTDNSFPPYFYKRDEQVYINTWHGTPLKTLGRSDIRNARSLANIQKNYLMCDYALFPNEFTRDVFMKDYMLENLYKGKVLLCDYPRNSALLDQQSADQIRKKMHLENKQLIAYMPTWRGSNRVAEGKIQRDILHKYFVRIDEKLNDHQIFYVNLHFLVANVIDYTQYKHIRPFPKEYETYDFLAVCDMLVTDYSSVFFDFAPTRKKIILFTYDLEEYMRDRGTYFPITDLPFPIVQNVDDLIAEINHDQPLRHMEEFLDKYCRYSDIQVSSKVLRLMICQDYSDLIVQDAPNNGKDNVLVYGGNLKKNIFNQLLVEYLGKIKASDPNKNIILCFNGTISERAVSVIQSLPEGVNCLALVKGFEASFIKRILVYLGMRSQVVEKCFHRLTSENYIYENNRLFYRIDPKKVIYYYDKPRYMYKIFEKFSCEKEAHIQNEVIVGVTSKSARYNQMISYFNKYYDKVIDHRHDDVRYLWKENEQLYYNDCLKVGNVIYHFSNKHQGLSIKALCVMVSSLPFPLNQLKMQVGEKSYDAKIHKGIYLGKGVYINLYTLMVPDADLQQLEIQNKVCFSYEDPEGFGLKKGIVYRLLHLKKGRFHNGPIKKFDDTATSAYYRQTSSNTLYLTIRKCNVTDSYKEQLKLFFAYYIAKILPMKKIILLFEKESERYEESASVLYEKLIDKGYDNAYFIIDAHYPHLNEIPKKYRSNLIYKATFKHYLYFFKSKTFLGSEALVHAIDLRISNKYALKKLQDQSIDYVFLQHGVMYMISLDSESRKFFKPFKTKGKYRVITSSKEEAKHFIELGNYNPEFIYITGLPKFDRNYLKKEADKIVIMLTWRPWEYNSARYDFESTKYYQMICRIFNAIPQAYREKVIILPHPLFFEAVKEAEFELKNYLNSETKYDNILREAKILITDYSSIAYDAFYRGTNVIFYWEEKDECLENYGPTTKLMLNEHNAYGDICYSAQDLSNVFEKNYCEGQQPEYIENYRHLVEYHDGHNADRLIECLKKDEII